MSENVKTIFLKNLKLFSSLTEDELQQINRRVILKEFRKNEIILYEQDFNQFMYIIVFGKVRVTQATDDGKEIILAFHESEESFGEISLIDGQSSPATVVAEDDSFIAIISKEDFFSLISDHSKIVHNLLQILCARLRVSWKQIQMLNLKDAEKRLKMLFLTFSYESGNKTQEGIVLDMHITHQSLADMTGLSRETVTRIINKWKNGGEINVLKNKSYLLTEDFLSMN